MKIPDELQGGESGTGKRNAAGAAGEFGPEESDDDFDGSATAPIEALPSADYSRAGELESRLEVPLALAGQRLDLVLANLLPEHSRSRLQGWIRDGRVRVDGVLASETKLKLAGGEALRVRRAPAPESFSFRPEPVDFPVIHEDEQIVIVDKPAGLVVHPGSGNWSGTLMNGLLHRYPETAGLPRAGVVHRLDKDTSGLMVVARSLTAQTDLVRQLQARTVKRQYLAVAIGRPAQPSGVIDAPIGRHPTQRTKMAVVENGKPARTYWRVVDFLRGTTLLRCDLDTGRTHQIRVHLASLRLPLVGDPLYRGRVQGPPFPRQALHAARLGLLHPGTGKAMEWDSPVPDDLAALIESLRIPEAGE